MSRLWLGRTGMEQELPAMGRRFAEEDFEIAREDRTASGKLVSDIIATKKKFNLSYSFITNEVLATLRGIYALGGILNLKIEQSDSSISEYQVKFRPFGRARTLLGNDWFWENITLILEEI